MDALENHDTAILGSDSKTIDHYVHYKNRSRVCCKISKTFPIILFMNILIVTITTISLFGVTNVNSNTTNLWPNKELEYFSKILCSYLEIAPINDNFLVDICKYAHLPSIYQVLKSSRNGMNLSSMGVAVFDNTTERVLFNTTFDTL